MNKYKIIAIATLFTGVIFAQNNVGINTKPAAKATLDVGGDMRVGEIYGPNNKTLPIIVDYKGYLYKTGYSEFEIGEATQYEESEGVNTKLLKKPFASIRIKARTNSMNEDKISNLDTKINAEKYTVALLGCYFRYQAWDLNQVPRTEKHYAIGLTPNKKAPQLDSNTFVEGNTWRIKTDYVDATPVYDYFEPNSHPEQRFFYWDMYLLVVKNIYMRDLGIQVGETKYNESYGYIGEAPTNPLP